MRIMAADWAEQEAETIVDAFVADTSASDLLRLQERIAAALRRAFERGRREGPAVQRA